MNAVIPRASIAEMVLQRNKAIALFESAHILLGETSRALAEARAVGFSASPSNSYTHASRDEQTSFLTGLHVPEQANFMKQATRMIDTTAWARIMEITDLERLMDKKAKDEFRAQMQQEPPELTEGNVMATLEQFFSTADTIFQRGIAECFSNLDRRFRSHDGWKIGSRVILSYAFNEWGSWSHHRGQRDTLMDIERTFLVLDGRSAKHAYAGIVGAVDAARGGGHGRRQGDVESDYFKIRTFMNGNCHIWFKRDDLLEKVNQLLGAYYNAGIPQEREPEDDGGLFTPKTSLAKNMGYFPTPDAAAATLLERASLYRRDDEPALTVLEPSAGDGALVRLALKEGAIVDAVELHQDRANSLRGIGARRVTCQDFLTLLPSADRLYDRVVMNPPFDRERDIDHVVHALKFLKPDGRLVAIMSAGTEFRETRKSVAFRAMVEKMNGSFRDLPAGSFSSVGTNVNTVILAIRQDGRPTNY
ncbi:DUF4942 domain-containing protein [Phreatobacter sp. HK31-P]